jgi:UDP-glucose 4-epimerase
VSGEFLGKRALVTGGLGFIGSNLAIRLVELGARVTIVDASIPGCGANPFNIQPAAGRVRVIPRDIGQAGAFSDVLRETQVIFNLAGEVSHVRSMECPERDLEINTLAQLRFLRECAKHARGVRIVYAGTRQVYGVPEALPVNESHSLQPVDFNGIHKYAAAMYHHMLTRKGDLDAIVLRLTNVYGPRLALNQPGQGVLSSFLGSLLRGEDLEVFGDGRQVRDPVFVDDVVEALLRAAATQTPRSRVFNVGGPQALPLGRIAEIASEAAGRGSVRYRPFPDERAAVDIGSYWSDCGRIRGELGWQPAVCFEEGIRRTLEYYRDNVDQYLPRVLCMRA